MLVKTHKTINNKTHTWLFIVGVLVLFYWSSQFFIKKSPHQFEEKHFNSVTSIHSQNKDLTSTPALNKINDLMSQVQNRIVKKEFNWDLSFFHSEDWLVNGQSVNGLPLIYWTCGQKNSKNRSLILSAVHGDEITPVYFGFRLIEWIKARPNFCHDKFIVVAPIVNPDGFLRYTNGTRTNYNKVDLNRNFDTPDWPKEAKRLWETLHQKRRRLYPGDRAASEPETLFQQWLIEEFNPNKILSVHAPLNILDYDGPNNGSAKDFSQKYIAACDNLKREMEKRTSLLKFYGYGHFPGSLGNYAGVQRGIPTITAELPSILASKAPLYFGLLEKSTRVFFEYQLSEETPSRGQSVLRTQTSH